MNWLVSLIGLVFKLWLNKPDPVAQEATEAATATQVAKDSDKALQQASSELQAAVNAPTNVDAELNAGTF